MENLHWESFNLHPPISDRLSCPSLGAFRDIGRKYCRVGRFLTWLEERFPEHAYTRPLLLSRICTCLCQRKRLTAVTGQEWNVRSMNQGKLEVVKQEMARVNIYMLGISELKWTGMGEFNTDDHYIYYCGQESLRRNGVALIVNRRI